VLLVGDSTMHSLTVGLQMWASKHPGYAEIADYWAPGMSFVRAGTIEDESLQGWASKGWIVFDEALVHQAPLLRPDVVVFMTTLSDAARRSWSKAEGALNPTDPRFFSRPAESYSNLASLALTHASRVVFIVPPVPLDTPETMERLPPEASRVLQDVVHETASAKARDGVSDVELQKWLDETGHSGRAWRPDGLHITDQHAAELAEQYLGPLLLSIAYQGS
jgi:hypothetical protein